MTGVRWGLWISFDMMSGIGLAAGAFSVAAIVYIFNLKKFYPIVRPSILTGFISYMLAGMTLLVDLSQPQRIWHLIIYWNIHSPLFEIGWCVMLYLTVLALEFSPVVFDALHWKVPLKIIRAIQIPLIIAGVTLSTMHQSTLGTMLTILPDKIHPLFYSPLFPLYFYRDRHRGRVGHGSVRVVPFLAHLWLPVRDQDAGQPDEGHSLDPGRLFYRSDGRIVRHR